MEGGGEAPAVVEAGPVENVRGVSEVEEAVQHNHLIDGGGKDSVMITARMVTIMILAKTLHRK